LILSTLTSKLGLVKITLPETRVGGLKSSSDVRQNSTASFRSDSQAMLLLQVSAAFLNGRGRAANPMDDLEVERI